ncbi:unnamed protein product [Darwinula stevensoni]|uniref:Protein zer-1 homolog-like C-terminal domain-containing protein n=1 Tax=Darwinula stevensoni TaxID=69355 RepID=A0A7R8X3S8_9CRUS|nr:unnamed protein product [Darwinula stevensoni]CAG0882850.1 unnamed protein product [Darwinula stevensoni]
MDRKEDGKEQIKMAMTTRCDGTLTNSRSLEEELLSEAEKSLKRPSALIGVLRALTAVLRFDTFGYLKRAVEVICNAMNFHSDNVKIHIAGRQRRWKGADQDGHDNEVRENPIFTSSEKNLRCDGPLTNSRSLEEELLSEAEKSLKRPSALIGVLRALTAVLRFDTFGYLKRAVEVICTAMNFHSDNVKIHIAGSAALLHMAELKSTELDVEAKKQILDALLASITRHRGQPEIMQNVFNAITQFEEDGRLLEYETVAQVLLSVIGALMEAGVKEESGLSKDENVCLYLGCLTLLQMCGGAERTCKERLGELGVMSAMINVIQLALSGKCLDAVMHHAWSALASLTDETPINSQRFLELQGMECFMACLPIYLFGIHFVLRCETSCEPSTPIPVKALRGKEDLLSIGIVAVGNVVEVPALRPQLLKPEYVNAFAKLLDSKIQGIEVSDEATRFLVNLLSDGEKAWTIEKPTRNEILDHLVAVLDSRDLSTRRNVKVTSFEPCFRLLRCDHVPQAQYWAIWSMANFIAHSPAEYCKLVDKDEDLELIQRLGQDQTIYPRIPELADVVMVNCVMQRSAAEEGQAEEVSEEVQNISTDPPPQKLFLKRKKAPVMLNIVKIYPNWENETRFFPPEVNLKQWLDEAKNSHEKMVRSLYWMLHRFGKHSGQPMYAGYRIGFELKQRYLPDASKSSMHGEHEIMVIYRKMGIITIRVTEATVETIGSCVEEARQELNKETAEYCKLVDKDEDLELIQRLGQDQTIYPRIPELADVVMVNCVMQRSAAEEGQAEEVSEEVQNISTDPPPQKLFLKRKKAPVMLNIVKIYPNWENETRFFPPEVNLKQWLDEAQNSHEKMVRSLYWMLHRFGKHSGQPMYAGYRIGFELKQRYLPDASKSSMHGEHEIMVIYRKMGIITIRVTEATVETIGSCVEEARQELNKEKATVETIGSCVEEARQELNKESEHLGELIKENEVEMVTMNNAMTSGLDEEELGLASFPVHHRIMAVCGVTEDAFTASGASPHAKVLFQKDWESLTAFERWWEANISSPSKIPSKTAAAPGVLKPFKLSSETYLHLLAIFIDPLREKLFHIPPASQGPKQMVMTSDQRKALDGLRSGDVSIIVGAAGTGKTFILREKIRSIVEGWFTTYSSVGHMKEKVLFVCSSPGLYAHLKSTIPDLLMKSVMSIIRQHEKYAAETEEGMRKLLKDKVVISTFDALVGREGKEKPIITTSLEPHRRANESEPQIKPTEPSRPSPAEFFQAFRGLFKLYLQVFGEQTNETGKEGVEERNETEESDSERQKRDATAEGEERGEGKQGTQLVEVGSQPGSSSGSWTSEMMEYVGMMVNSLPEGDRLRDFFKPILLLMKRILKPADRNKGASEEDIENLKRMLGSVEPTFRHVFIDEAEELYLRYKDVWLDVLRAHHDRHESGYFCFAFDPMYHDLQIPKDSSFYGMLSKEATVETIGSCVEEARQELNKESEHLGELMKENEVEMVTLNNAMNSGLDEEELGLASFPVHHRIMAVCGVTEDAFTASGASPHAKVLFQKDWESLTAFERWWEANISSPSKIPSKTPAAPGVLKPFKLSPETYLHLLAIFIDPLREKLFHIPPASQGPKQMVMTSDQRKALDELRSGDVSIIVGAAGTGKTFILREKIRSIVEGWFTTYSSVGHMKEKKEKQTSSGPEIRVDFS